MAHEPGHEETIQDGGEPDRVAQAKRLQHQCYLIYNFDPIARENAGHTFKNFVPIGIPGQRTSPNEIVQKLLAIPKLGDLMHIKPYLLSSLVPQIRIYKVNYPSPDSKGDAIEMPFEDHLNPANSIDLITAQGAQRGMGVGLKSMEWELLGTNPAESDNNIKAKLKLHFNSLEDFIAERSRSEEGEPVSYMNLIVPVRRFDNDSYECPDENNESSQTEGQRNYNDRYFRLKAAVGYGIPAGSIWENQQNSGLVNSIRNAMQFLYLTLISHSLDFKEDGSLDLEIEYAAAMEGLLNHKKADVLMVADEASAVNAQITVNNAERQAHATAVSTADCNSPDGADSDASQEARSTQEEREEEMRAQEQEDRAKLYNGLLSVMEKSNNLWGVEVTSEDIGAMDFGQARNGGDIPRTTYEMGSRFQVEGATADLQDGINEAATAEDASESVTTFTNDPPEPDELQITFFYFGDLMDAAFQCLYKGNDPESKQLKELKIITGPLVYYDPRLKRIKYNHNIADVPISLNLFQIWFMDNVVAPQRKVYKLKNFLKDAVTGLISAATKPACFGKEYGTNPVNLQMQMLQVPAMTSGEGGNANSNSDSCEPTGKCRITRKSSVIPYGAIGRNRVPLEGIAPYPELGANADFSCVAMVNYLFIYATSSGATMFGPPSDSGMTREERDSNLGVYHFRIGADGGLLKKVKFKKSDQPYAREARMERAGELDGATLREKYDADIDMFGNSIFRPGMHVYINPASVGAGDPARINTIARRLGLGGYFMITNVKCAIEAGKFQTDLKTVWVANGSGNAPDDVCSADSDCPSDGQ